MTQVDDAAWTTTASPDELAGWLKQAASATLLTHARPDGDAAGSTLALCRALRTLGIDATCWYAGALPLWLKRLAGDTPYKHIDVDGLPPETDIGVICDTGSWSQLDPARAWIEGKADRLAIIDHHLHGNAEIADRRWLTTDAAAACQPVARLCARLLDVDSISQLPADIASACYFGIGTDTGWFRHSNVSAEVLEDAASLLRAGAKHTLLYTASEQRDRPSRLKLVAAALGSAHFISDDRAVFMSLSLEDLHAAGATNAETGGIIDQAMGIESVRVGALLTQVHDDAHADGPLTKVSFRSKELGEESIDVNVLAQQFGGGGHARAAGARCAMTLSDTREALTAALEKVLP